MPTAPDAAALERSTQQTLAWIEHAVIGLNLCPFAKAPWSKGQIRCVSSASDGPQGLLEDLRAELERLDAADPDVTETTLLVIPGQFDDFGDFNDFLDIADMTLAALGYEGTIQIASFHPRYQFAGTQVDDIENATNRSPYPTLHLLREASVDRAVAAFPEAETIYEANIRTLHELGAPGWAALQQRFGAGEP